MRQIFSSFSRVQHFYSRKYIPISMSNNFSWYVRTVRFTYSIDYYITLRHNVSQRNPSTFGWLQLNILSQPVLSSTLLQLRYQVGKFITTRMQSSIITPRRYVTFYFYLQKKCLQIWITLTPSMIRLQFEIL